jgi:hypothetical protein
MEKIQNLRGGDSAEDDEALADLHRHYQQRFEDATTSPITAALAGTNYVRYRQLESELRRVERATILRLRDRNQINDEVLRTLERELDLLDARDLSIHH